MLPSTPHAPPRPPPSLPPCLLAGHNTIIKHGGQRRRAFVRGRLVGGCCRRCTRGCVPTTHHALPRRMMAPRRAPHGDGRTERRRKPCRTHNTCVSRGDNGWHCFTQACRPLSLRERCVPLHTERVIPPCAGTWPRAGPARACVSHAGWVFWYCYCCCSDSTAVPEHATVSFPSSSRARFLHLPPVGSP